jgi:very-short-patch-repair endonuclease
MRKSKKYKALPYNSALCKRAAELRKAGNLSEVLIWRQLQKRKFRGYDFDRQKIIGNFIVDFFCIDCNVVIEIDGISHDGKIEYDRKREKFLVSLRLTIIHISAKDVLQNLEGVIRFLFEHPALSPEAVENGI